MKIRLLLVLFFTCLSLYSVPPSNAVSLINNTSCEITDNDLSRHQTVMPVTVYLFYYDNGNEVFYGSIPPNETGTVPVSVQPRSAGYGINLGYSPTQSSISAVEIPSGWYIIQMVLTNSSTCTQANPCLHVIATDPCA